MKISSAAGFNEFVLALGYKGERIKDHFFTCRYHARSLTVPLQSSDMSSVTIGGKAVIGASSVDGLRQIEAKRGAAIPTPGAKRERHGRP